MGNSDSHAAFVDGVKRLVEEDVPEKDSEFWTALFTAQLSAEDVFAVISPDAVRSLRKRRPQNLQVFLRKLAANMAEVCAAADEGITPIPQSTQSRFNTTLRLLTRVAPLLMEDPEDSLVKDILWRPGGLQQGEGQIVEDAASETDFKPRPCGQELLHYVSRYLFLPGFTIKPRSDMAGKQRGTLPTHRVDDRVVWAGGVGVSEKVAVMHPQAFLRARTEVLRCILACLSAPLFQSAAEYQERPPLWLQHFTGGNTCHTANIFCSLMSTVFAYDPVGRGVPYGGYFTGSLEEELVDVALQVLCVVMDFQQPEEEPSDAGPASSETLQSGWFLVDNSQLQANSHGLGYRSSKNEKDIVPSKTAVWGEKVPGSDEGDGWVKVGELFLPTEIRGKKVLLPQDESPQAARKKSSPRNVYRYMLQHVTKDAEIDLIFFGIVRLLSSVHQAEKTYLPNSFKSIGFYQEALVLLWHLLTLNPSFTKRVTDRQDTNQILLPVLYLLQQARDSIQLVGLLHTASFVLLVLSSERSFAVRLNEQYTPKKVPLEIPAFSGSHADVLALTLHKVISDSLGKPQNDSLVEMLLTALCNVSPYIKSFALESCLKLLSLTERLAKPSYFFRSSFTHHGLVFLVEMLNNLIQYQFEGNVMMVYAVLRQADVFQRLMKLSLDSYRKKAKPQSEDAEDGKAEAAWEPTEEWLAAVKKKMPLQTIDCLIEHLNPQIEALCTESDVMDQDEVLRYLRGTTLVGILPVPHPIVIRTYQASSYTSMWFTSYMWGVIFTRSQRMPLYDWKQIRLVVINQ
eukprot:TRINITY_DN38161_c0_g1_i1.p1 TRINITY_DN38161_c0_g1~~TRINITY_DN38161_c0_g1_i1.p1  ORF type:complete len:796 (-),score=179.95 TRINITY_DN38161_c0_g1_i1:43-2430(-)